MNRNRIGFFTYLILSTLVLSFVFFVFPNTLGNFPGYSSENVMPNGEGVFKSLLLIIPITLLYLLVTRNYFRQGFKGYNKFVYPIILFTSYTLFFALGVTFFGQAFLWLLLVTISPIFIGIIIAFIVGISSDVKYKKEKASV